MKLKYQLYKTYRKVNHEVAMIWSNLPGAEYEMPVVFQKLCPLITRTKANT
jgi:hypothetical protein